MPKGTVEADFAVHEAALRAKGFMTWLEMAETSPDMSAGRDPYEDLIGPLFMRTGHNTAHKSAFIARNQHQNWGGAVHGGMLMSFADYTLFVIAHQRLKTQNCVTVSLNTDFLSAGRAGDIIYGSGDIVRETRSMLFIQGRLYSAAGNILSFNGILKRINMSGEKT